MSHIDALPQREEHIVHHQQQNNAQHRRDGPAPRETWARAVDQVSHAGRAHQVVPRVDFHQLPPRDCEQVLQHASDGEGQPRIGVCAVDAGPKETPADRQYVLEETLGVRQAVHDGDDFPEDGRDLGQDIPVLGLGLKERNVQVLVSAVAVDRDVWLALVDDPRMNLELALPQGKRASCPRKGPRRRASKHDGQRRRTVGVWASDRDGLGGPRRALGARNGTDGQGEIERPRPALRAPRIQRPIHGLGLPHIVHGAALDRQTGHCAVLADSHSRHRFCVGPSILIDIYPAVPDRLDRGQPEPRHGQPALGGRHRPRPVLDAVERKLHVVGHVFGPRPFDGGDPVSVRPEIRPGRPPLLGDPDRVHAGAQQEHADRRRESHREPQDAPESDTAPAKHLHPPYQVRDRDPRLHELVLHLEIERARPCLAERHPGGQRHPANVKNRVLDQVIQYLVDHAEDGELDIDREIEEIVSLIPQAENLLSGPERKAPGEDAYRKDTKRDNPQDIVGAGAQLGLVLGCPAQRIFRHRFRLV